jgi:hypothetical protein
VVGLCALANLLVVALIIMWLIELIGVLTTIIQFLTGSEGSCLTSSSRKACSTAPERRPQRPCAARILFRIVRSYR